MHMGNHKHSSGGASPAKRVFAAVVVVFAVLAAAAIWYVNDYYHADDSAIGALESSASVEVRAIDGGIAFVPSEPIAGLAFYPGAKVEPEAYAPLMRACAERGLACVLIKPPFNLSIFDVGAARHAMDQLPNIDTWIVAGHSMGGVAAGSFAASNPSDADAVVLLGAYLNDDLTAYDGVVLLVSGRNDEVLNRDKYENAKSMLPSRTTEITIEGGNHAGFGNYGEQAGDGEAGITRESQQSQTAAAISELALAS